MQPIAETSALLAIFNLGGGEIILILALVLILIGARKLPGSSRGIFEFFQAIKHVRDEIDEQASEAGRSVGGIYGKPAAQALTPDNHVAELYDPPVLQPKTPRRRRTIKVLRKFWWRIRRLVRAIRGARDRHF